MVIGGLIVIGTNIEIRARSVGPLMITFPEDRVVGANLCVDQYCPYVVKPSSGRTPSTFTRQAKCV